MDSLLLAHRSAFMNSWHAQLAINLGVLGTGSILLAHLLLAFPAYAFLCMDWSTELSLFTHHAWIGGFFIVGAGAHAALFLVVDYRAGTLRGVERLLLYRVGELLLVTKAVVFGRLYDPWAPGGGDVRSLAWPTVNPCG